ncbi:MAG: ATP phosphoribosyltransferase [Chloroflexota bacterium]
MPRPIRLSLPSKGRLAEDALSFLERCGLKVYRPNPRQYEASLPDLPGLRVIFQRPTDIVVSVRDGSVDFGISGLDVVEERRGDNGEIIVVHDALGFGQCSLGLAIPEAWPVQTIEELRRYAASQAQPLRVATHFLKLTKRFLEAQKIHGYTLVEAEGTLEVAPAIGYADMICDLIASGQTLRDNRLRPLADGYILHSQAVLIANRAELQTNPTALKLISQMLEYIEAHLRAEENYLVIANMRGDSPATIAQALFARAELSGLQGPTIAPIFTRDGEPYCSVSIVVRKVEVIPAVRALRAVGGSGVIVTPVTYIFEEEPPRYKAMLENLKLQAKAQA